MGPRFKERFWDLYEMIPGFAAGFLCTVFVSLAGEPDREALAEVEEARQGCRAGVLRANDAPSGR